VEERRDRDLDTRRREIFGRRVRELRRAAGYSQDTFAHRARLDRSVVGYIERGTREVGVTTLWWLADALGVPIADLFDFSEDPLHLAPPE